MTIKFKTSDAFEVSYELNTKRLELLLTALRYIITKDLYRVKVLTLHEFSECYSRWSCEINSLHICAILEQGVSNHRHTSKILFKDFKYTVSYAKLHTITLMTKTAIVLLSIEFLYERI